jgi:hypothetical protein
VRPKVSASVHERSMAKRIATFVSMSAPRIDQIHGALNVA